MRILILMILFSGCSFKKPETDVAGEKQNARPAKSTHYVVISTEDGAQWERDLVLTNSEYRSLEAVTLPAIVPDSILLTIRLPKIDSPIVQIESSFTHIDHRKVGLISKNMGEITVADSLSEMNLNISGMKAIFNDNIPETGYLVINLISELGTTYTIKITARTPPLDITVTRTDDNEANIARVQNGYDDYEMVYSFKVENPNPFPVEFSIAKEHKGKLHTVWRNIHHVDDGCFFKWSDTSWDHIYSEEFFVLRSNNEIYSDILNSNENIIQLLDSNQSVVLGVYSKTPAAAELIRNKGEPLYYETTEQVLIKCVNVNGQIQKEYIPGYNDTIRYGVYFTPEADKNLIGTRYADTSFRSDPISRQRLPMKDTLKIYKGWPTLE